MRSFYRATPVGPTVGSGVPPARRPRNRQTGDSIAVLESWSQRRDRALRPRPPSGRLRPCLTRPAPVGAGRWRRSLLGGRRRSFGAPDGRGDEQRRRRVPLGRWLRFAQSPCTSHPALRARRSSVTPKRVLGRRVLRVGAAADLMGEDHGRLARASAPRLGPPRKRACRLRDHDRRRRRPRSPELTASRTRRESGRTRSATAPFSCGCHCQRSYQSIEGSD